MMTCKRCGHKQSRHRALIERFSVDDVRYHTAEPCFDCACRNFSFYGVPKSDEECVTYISSVRESE